MIWSLRAPNQPGVGLSLIEGMLILKVLRPIASGDLGIGVAGTAIFV